MLPDLWGFWRFSFFKLTIDQIKFFRKFLEVGYPVLHAGLTCQPTCYVSLLPQLFWHINLLGMSACNLNILDTSVYLTCQLATLAFLTCQPTWHVSLSPQLSCHVSLLKVFSTLQYIYFLFINNKSNIIDIYWSGKKFYN